MWWRLLFILSSTIGFVPVSRHRINRKQVCLLGQRQRWLRPVLALGTVPLPSIGVLANNNNENAAAADDVPVASARNESSKRNVLLPRNRPAPAQTVLLLSLQHPEHTGRFSKTVADVWRWKDAVLGDGRDFFVPRPKTLAALQRYLQAYVVDEPKIDAVVVLSNCARLELLVVIGSRDNNNKNHEDEDEKPPIRGGGGGDGTSPSSPSCSLLQESISHALLRQVQHVQKLRFGPPPLDWPASIMATSSTRSSSSNHVDHNSSDMDRAMVEELARHWQIYDTMPAILTHWCHVAAGMASRPNRPDRHSNDTNNNICFRPFSSRDAHIMLQMKRLVTGDDNTATTKWIVDTALAAGKAARSNAIVQSQRPLLLDSTHPLPRIVAQQVQEQVLAPLVDRALLQWQAKSASGMIQQWRQRALALAQSDEERYWIQRSPLLHKATMALRRQAHHHHHDDDAHDVVNVFLKDLEERLETQRKESIG
jgi:hypothetical protein